MANRREKVEAVADFIFLGSKITVDGNCSYEIKRCLILGRKAMTSPEGILLIKSRNITLLAKVHIVKVVVFPVVIYECELYHKEVWAPKNWCFWIVVWEKTVGSPLDCKESKLVHPKGNQPWIFTGRTDAKAEGPILWQPDAKTCLTGKDPAAGKGWRQEEKGVTEDEMVW